jgi:4-carboxymuconolactone decarboxylase
MTNREAGINVVREMMGDQAAAKLSASADSNTFGAPIAAYALDQAFADIWTRPGLDRRSRSLVSMSVMIAMRQPHEFAIHMGAGLNNGLTLKEIEEVLIQALPYVGYPAIATSLAAAAEVIKEHGLKDRTHSKSDSVEAIDHGPRLLAFPIARAHAYDAGDEHRCPFRGTPVDPGSKSDRNARCSAKMYRFSFVEAA